MSTVTELHGAVGDCGRIAIDPKNAQLGYVAFAVYGNSSFWRSTHGVLSA